jgi:hypothetical protein
MAFAGSSVLTPCIKAGFLDPSGAARHPPLKNGVIPNADAICGLAPTPGRSNSMRDSTCVAEARPLYANARRELRARLLLGRRYRATCQFHAAVKT